MQQYKKYLKSKHLKSSTIKNYLWHVDKFLKWLDQDKISQTKLQEYFKYLLKKYQRVNTINLRLKILNNYLKFLNKSFQFDLLSDEDTDIEILNPEQLQKFLKNPIQTKNKIALRDKALLEILYYSGMKVGQLTELKIEQIDHVKQELFLDKNHVVKINPSSWTYLKKYLASRHDDNPYLFINFDRSEKSDKQFISVRSIERLIKKYAKNINPLINITPQILRNTLAYRLKSQGAQKEHIKSALHFQTKTGAKNYFKKI